MNNYPIKNGPLGAMLRDDFMRSMTSAENLEKIQEMSAPFRELMAYYKCAMMEIETKFNVLNEEFSIQYDRNPIETIKTRLKSPESLLEKISRNGYPFTFDSIEQNIYDVAGVRVICSFPEDIYMLAECLLKQDDVKLIAQKDYIQLPKDNGYRSLHLIVETPIFLTDKKKMMKVEIQLRTIAMDFWASLEHKMKYKKGIPDSDGLTDELRQCANLISELDRRMEAIRHRIDLGTDK